MSSFNIKPDVQFNIDHTQDTSSSSTGYHKLDNRVSITYYIIFCYMRNVYLQKATFVRAGRQKELTDIMEALMAFLAQVSPRLFLSIDRRDPPPLHQISQLIYSVQKFRSEGDQVLSLERNVYQPFMNLRVCARKGIRLMKINKTAI